MIKDYITELETATQESAKILKEINKIVDILSNDEISLIDIIANQEQLKESCDDLQKKCEEIISLRQYIDFENSKPRF